MSRSVAIFDLDHGLLAVAPDDAVAGALREAGVRQAGAMRWMQRAHRALDAVAGPFAAELTVRASVRALAGVDVDDLRTAGKGAGAALSDRVARHARPIMAEHRAADRRILISTSLPAPMAEAIAEQLGCDGAIATQPAVESGRLTGALAGPAVWGRGKLDAARRWAKDHGAVLRRSYAYAGSLHDAPLLADVGRPMVVDPDPRLAVLAWLKGWPTRSLHVPAGVPTIARRELQELSRPLMRPEFVPYARFTFEDLDCIPAQGAAIVCANHRSYFDSVAMALALARRGRSVRFLGKKEVFDAPVIGAAARWIGGIRVERGTGSDEPLLAAANALEAGEVVMIMPEGTIPRGPAFFDPELKGRWGTARLAALTRAPVVPIGLWGTEKVWPRSSRLPILDPRRRPLVTVRAGPEVELSYDDADADTTRIMRAIGDLLPPEARERRTPSDEELARTYPSGYKGDPSRETGRRPGSDT